VSNPNYLPRYDAPMGDMAQYFEEANLLGSSVGNSVSVVCSRSVATLSFGGWQSSIVIAALSCPRRDFVLGGF
jgi:hypothetical protein